MNVIQELVTNEEIIKGMIYRKYDYCNAKGDLIRDLLALVNMNYPGDKFLVCKINDYIQVEKIISEDYWVRFVLDIIGPKIKFKYNTYISETKGKFRVFQIHKDNKDRPYMAKKDYLKSGEIINKSDCFILKGNIIEKANRDDFDIFYKESQKINFYIRDKVFHVKNYRRNNENNYIPVRLSVINKSTYPLVVVSGYIIIKNSYNEILAKVKLAGFNKNSMIEESNLIVLNKFHGKLLFEFNDNDCVKIALNEFGYSTWPYNLELALIDVEGKVHRVKKNNCYIFARGDILNKVRRLKGSNSNRVRSTILLKRARFKSILK